MGFSFLIQRCFFYQKKFGFWKISIFPRFGFQSVPIPTVFYLFLTGFKIGHNIYLNQVQNTQSIVSQRRQSSNFRLRFSLFGTGVSVFSSI